MQIIFAQTEARRQDLIGLTQDLIRIPTLNPPGDHYRTICDYLATRLQRSGFTTEFIRAIGAPGDIDQYPRWNLIARREGLLGCEGVSVPRGGEALECLAAR